MCISLIKGKVNKSTANAYVSFVENEKPKMRIDYSLTAFILLNLTRKYLYWSRKLLSIITLEK